MAFPVVRELGTVGRATVEKGLEVARRTIKKRTGGMVAGDTGVIRSTITSPGDISTRESNEEGNVGETTFGEDLETITDDFVKSTFRFIVKMVTIGHAIIALILFACVVMNRGVRYVTYETIDVTSLVVLDTTGIIDTGFKDVASAVDSVADVGSSVVGHISSGFRGGGSSFHAHIPTIDLTSYIRPYMNDMTNVPVECNAVRSFSDTFAIIMSWFFDDYRLCYTIEYLRPVTIAHAILHGLFSPILLRDCSASTLDRWCLFMNLDMLIFLGVIIYVSIVFIVIYFWFLVDLVKMIFKYTLKPLFRFLRGEYKAGEMIAH